MILYILIHHLEISPILLLAFLDSVFSCLEIPLVPSQILSEELPLHILLLAFLKMLLFLIFVFFRIYFNYILFFKKYSLNVTICVSIYAEKYDKALTTEITINSNSACSLLEFDKLNKYYYSLLFSDTDEFKMLKNERKKEYLFETIGILD